MLDQELTVNYELKWLTSQLSWKSVFGLLGRQPGVKSLAKPTTIVFKKLERYIMLAIIMSLGGDVKAISLVSSVRTATHHYFGRECRTCDMVQTAGLSDCRHWSG